MPDEAPLTAESADHSRPVLDDTHDQVGILVVDDRAQNRLVLETILEELDQRIVAVGSGEEALKQLLEQDFAVILLDVNMPGMDGLETARYVRGLQRTAHTPIIFLTAEAEEMNAAYSLGAVDYILTPVRPEILRSKVKVFVQLHQMHRQVQKQAAERIALANANAGRAAAEESKRRSNFLAAASDVLSSSLDVDTVAKALAKFAVPFVADFSAVLLADDGGAIRRAELFWCSTDGGEGTAASLPHLPNDTISAAVERALQSGHRELLGELDNLTMDLGALAAEGAPARPVAAPYPLRSLVVLPLMARERKLGALLLGLAAGTRNFSMTDLALAEDLAARTAVSLDNCLLYAKIQDADQRKNEFLAMLAHELRNPLAPIRNAVYLLSQPGNDSERVAWASKVIDRQTRQLVRLVDDLLDVARITQGRIQLTLEAVNVTDVVNLAMEMSRPLIEARRHEVTTTLAEEPLFVHGDHARVTQIIANLVNNAAKYTDRGGRISVSAEEDGTDVVLRVKDTGMGIPHDMLASIFDLFTQSECSLDRSQGGLGVGLTIVQRLARMQGGNVYATSAGAGQGSEFVVRLPRAAAAGTRPEAIAANADATGLTVMVVDDYVDSAESMASLLKLDGHFVRVAHGARDAIELARTFKPAVVFLDIGLPDMNGYEVAQHLRALPGGTEAVLVALTGYGQPDDLERSKAAGFDHHLVKPIDPSILQTLFKSLLAAPARSAALH
jgi:signal transduction histidine kinase/DNA-binding response OmpR family regulator